MFLSNPILYRTCYKKFNEKKYICIDNVYETEPVIMSTSFLQYLINLLNKNPQIFSFNEHSLIISSVGFESSLA